MRINTSKQFAYLNSSSKKFNANNQKNKVYVDLKIGNNDEKVKQIANKKRVIKYILEGGVIKVYLYENGNKKCIKTIPLSQASPSILALVENISFKDILKIIEMQKKGKAL